MSKLIIKIVERRLTIKTPERRQNDFNDVFLVGFSVNFEHISQLCLAFLLLN